MKTILQGRKKTTIDHRGNTTCWTSILEYECRNENVSEEAKNAAGDAGSRFQSKFDKCFSLSSSSSGSNVTPQDKISKETITSHSQTTMSSSKNDVSYEKEEVCKNACTPATPALPASSPEKTPQTEPLRRVPSTLMPKKNVNPVNAEVQCQLDENEMTSDMDFEEITKIYNELNAVFERRAADVKSQVPHDIELQIKTHEEWCENLLKCNAAINDGIKSLKNDLKNVDSPSPVLNETDLKFEHDRDSLAKLVQERFQSGKWNFNSLVLETVPYKEILNVDSDYSSEAAECSQLPQAERSKERRKSLFTNPKN